MFPTLLTLALAGAPAAPPPPGHPAVERPRLTDAPAPVVRPGHAPAPVAPKLAATQAPAPAGRPAYPSLLAKKPASPYDSATLLPKAPVPRYGLGLGGGPGRRTPREGPSTAPFTPAWHPPMAPPPLVPAHARAFYCESNIGGAVPQIGPVRHASVAVCPPGAPPTVAAGGRSFNNPACTFYGTQPGTSTFQVEPYRFDVTCRPSRAPASVVQQRIDSFRRPYSLLTNNCQHAASWATRK